MYRSAYDALKSYVVTHVNEDKASNMRATGLPPHLVVAAEIKELRKEIAELKDSQSQQMEDLKRSFFSKMEDMVEIMGSLPQALHKELLDHFTVEGVAPLNMRDVEAVIARNNRELLDKMREIFGQCSATGPTNTEEAKEEQCVVHDETFESFTWGGRFGRIVPEDFLFPHGDVKTIWDLWYFGNTRLKVRPYRELLKHKGDLKDKGSKERFSKAANIMKRMEDMCFKHGLIPEEHASIADMDVIAADEVFETVLPLVVSDLYGEGKKPNCKRLHEVKITTLANKAYKNNAAAKRSRRAYNFFEPFVHSTG